MKYQQIQQKNHQHLLGFESAINRLQQQTTGVYLLHGHSSIFTTSLLIGSASSRPLVVIDGAMRFNSYTIPRIAANLHISPRQLLRRTYITRSFTAFQTESVITNKLPKFLQTLQHPLVIALGLLDTYYDEQVKPHECEQSLHRIMAQFHTLADANIPILIADTEITTAPPDKKRLFQILRNQSNFVLLLQPTEHGLQLIEERSTRYGTQ